MKKLLPALVACCGVVTSVYGQTDLLAAGSASAAAGAARQPDAQADYIVTERGPHHRVWSQVVWKQTPRGPVARTNSYTELCGGLHYLNQGQWVEAREQIEAFPGGAVARQGQHQVIFANNLATAGAIDMLAPDGQRFQSHILGLSYYCPSTGQNVLIAEVKDCQGQILEPNQVVYLDAFTDIRASVRYTYTRSGFEQDIIIESALPDPEEFGLSSGDCVLQVLTEFIAPNDPLATAREVRFDSGVQVQDQDLDFGALKMGRGRAFSLEPAKDNKDIPVFKQWGTIEGRRILAEQVPVPEFKAQAGALPKLEGASYKPSTNSVRYLVSNTRQLPPAPKARAKEGAMEIASISLPTRGVLLDYVTVSTSYSNYTFHSDQTYYISGPVTMSGTTVFEGGAVLKFPTNSTAKITASGTIDCQSAPYRPIVFTSMHDDSCGAKITGSTGKPTKPGSTGTTYLEKSAGFIQYARFAYAGCAVSDLSNGDPVWHSQFLKCYTGMKVMPSSTYTEQLLRNVLVSDCSVGFQNTGASGTYLIVTGEHLTADQVASSLVAGVYPNRAVVTNSLLTAVTCTASLNLYNSARFSSAAGIYQSVGGGNYYLASGSTNRNAGTTNINSTLAKELKKRTTYPPVLQLPFTSWADLTYSPQAQRDTDIPDLGWHYEPLDYVLSGVCVQNATLKLTAGTAVGVFGTNLVTYGLGIGGTNSQFLCQGAANSLIEITTYNTVQEQSPTNWVIPTYGLFTEAFAGVPKAVSFRFVDGSILAQDAPHISAYNERPITLQDCQFHGGILNDSYPAVNLINCLLERVNTSLWPMEPNTLVVRNNLVKGGTFDFYPLVTNSVVKDNLFDRAMIPTNNVPYTGGYNAYVSNYSRLVPTKSTDIVLANSPAYQVGPLGNYYLLSASGLINMDTTTAANTVGLYHYTVMTNLVGGYQIKETNSWVDIGYHYVATDGVGNPLDWDGDGVADYVEDANGDGSANDLTSWQTYNSRNGLTTTSKLQVFTPLR